MEKKKLFVMICCQIGLFTGGNVQAITIDASTSISFGTSTSPDSNSASSGSVSASSLASNGNPNYYAKAYSAEDGKLHVGTRIDYNYDYDSGISEFGAEPHTNIATSRWSTTHTHTGTTQPLTLDFNIEGGEIGFTTLYFEESYLAGYGINILLDNNSIWSSHGESGIGSGNPFGPTLLNDSSSTFMFGDLDGNQLAHNASGNGTVSDPKKLVFDPFSGSLDLGTYANGQSFTLTYEMTTYAKSEYFIGNDYIYAQFGDPLTISGTPGMSGSISTVPVPAALWLFASALGFTGYLGRVNPLSLFSKKLIARMADKGYSAILHHQNINITNPKYNSPISRVPVSTIVTQ